MDHNDCGGRTERFAAYLADLSSVLGDARRHGPMISYCTGLLLPADRKSVEPMAAMTAPTRTADSISRCCISSGRAIGPTRL